MGRGINSAGDVVGTSRLVHEGNARHAFLWQGGEMYDLNELIAGNPGIVLTEGMDINDKGQIVAQGYSIDDPGIRRSYLLTPPSLPTLIKELAGFIEGLELPDGLENALLVKLQDALAALDAGVISEACDLLGAFVNHVEAQAGKKLSSADAADAIAQATAVRDALGCLE